MSRAKSANAVKRIRSKPLIYILIYAYDAIDAKRPTIANNNK